MSFDEDPGFGSEYVNQDGGHLLDSLSYDETFHDNDADPDGRLMTGLQDMNDDSAFFPGMGHDTSMSFAQDSAVAGQSKPVGPSSRDAAAGRAGSPLSADKGT